MQFDHVVVGAGVMGAATAMSLADAGGKVLLLEQFSVGHTRGSSHGRSRIFRFSYPDEMYVRMAQEALGLWRRAEERSRVTLLTATGGLDVGEGIESNARALQLCGATAEMMTGTEAAARFGHVCFPDDVPVLFSPDSGTLAADSAVRTFVELARDSGAEVREGVTVSALEDSSDGVVVVTDAGRVRAGRVVVTAGAWAKKLLATAGIDLPVWVTQETVAFFEFRAPVPTIVDWGDPTVYALPSPGQGIKAARHIAGPRVDPDSQGEPDRSSVEIVGEWVSAHYKGIAETPHLVETCLYTNTDDQNFVLERHGNIVVGSPCSGHGFKFAPLIGERLAALARA